MGVMRPELVMKSIVPVRGGGRGDGQSGAGAVGARAAPAARAHPSASPPPQVVMAGVLGIYGLIIAVIISTGSESDEGGTEAGIDSNPDAALTPTRPHKTPFPPFSVNQTADKPYYFFDGYAHLASGLSCGLAGLAAGMAIGVVGDAGVRANAQQPKLFVGMILILIFAEALALYGLIGAGGGGGAGGRARDYLPRTPGPPSRPPPPPSSVGIILASKAGTAVPGP